MRFGWRHKLTCIFKMYLFNIHFFKGKSNLLGKVWLRLKFKPLGKTVHKCLTNWKTVASGPSARIEFFYNFCWWPSFCFDSMWCIWTSRQCFLMIVSNVASRDFTRLLFDFTWWPISFLPHLNQSQTWPRYQDYHCDQVSWRPHKLYALDHADKQMFMLAGI